MTTDDIIEEAEKIVMEARNQEIEPTTREQVLRLTAFLEQCNEEQLPEVLATIARQVAHAKRERAITSPELLSLYRICQQLSLPRVYFSSSSMVTRPRPFLTLGLPYPSSRLIFSNKAIAIISSLLFTSLAGFSSLIYGVITSSLIAIWSGLCLLALIIYEIIRINKK